jgi:2-iminobutanoate/2-iminopropanoate deaminase
MKCSPVFLLPALALALGCQTSAPGRPTRAPDFLTSPQEAALSLPFSEAVRAGDFLILSGQIGNVPGKLELVPGGIGPEATQALDHIKAILERHGASMDDVVKCTVFLADIREWPAFNAVYRNYFPHHFPARSALATSGLAIGGAGGGRVHGLCAPIPSEARRLPPDQTTGNSCSTPATVRAQRLCRPIRRSAIPVGPASRRGRPAAPSFMHGSSGSAMKTGAA